MSAATPEKADLFARLRAEFQGCDLRTHEDEIVIYCGTLAWAVPLDTCSLEDEIIGARAWFKYR